MKTDNINTTCTEDTYPTQEPTRQHPNNSCRNHGPSVREEAPHQRLSPEEARIADQILVQVGRCAVPTKNDNVDLLFESVIWLMRELKPQGGLESMVVSQAVASHLIIMNQLNVLAREPSLQAEQSRATIITKLQKSFNQHLNLLASLRGMRQQQIRIEKIDINGGQAVVGCQVGTDGRGA